MIVRTRTILAATVCIGLLGCGRVASPSAVPSAVPSSAASLGLASPSALTSPDASGATSATPQPTARVVESARHRYRIEVPSDWAMTEYDGTWETIDQFGVGVEVPGEDVIDSSSLGAFVVLNSMVIPDDMSSEAWLAAFGAVVASALPPDCPGSPVGGTFAGESAIVLEQTCGGSSIVGRSFVHAGRGYYVTTVSPVGGGAGPILDEMLASMTFLD
jgi:hypothetical protein